MLGVGRLTALAKHAGVSKQAMSKKIKTGNYDELVTKVESLEMFSEKDAQNNVLKAAKYMVSGDINLANYAFNQFQKWGKIYGSLVNSEANNFEVFDRNVDFRLRLRKAETILSKLTKSNQINVCEIMEFTKEKSYSIRSGRTAPSWEELEKMEKLVLLLWG